MAKSPPGPFQWFPGDELLFVAAASLIKKQFLDRKKQFSVEALVEEDFINTYIYIKIHNFMFLYNIFQ